MLPVRCSLPEPRFALQGEASVVLLKYPLLQNRKYLHSSKSGYYILSSKDFSFFLFFKSKEAQKLSQLHILILSCKKLCPYFGKPDTPGVKILMKTGQVCS